MIPLVGIPTALAGCLETGASSLLAMLVAIFSCYQYDTTGTTSRPIDITQQSILDVYDFIIVGGGSAGSVLANRLSEIKDWKVLLLEAGWLENVITDTPLLGITSQSTPLDWQFKTEPQRNACLAMIDRRSTWSRGKVLGGTSVLNFMMYVRGNKRDYDRWESLGNPGWGYEDVLPYFKKSEDMQIEELLENGYHGSGGYLTVSKLRWMTPLAEAFVQAGVQLGYKNGDFNGECQTVFGLAQVTIRQGSRCSTAKAFILPAITRSNLHISLGSQVLRVLIDPVTKAVYGVEYERLGVVYTVKAAKEVILSAGAIKSPQLLMLSGIGPKEHLEGLGIQTLQDLKVGCNLQEHVALGGLTFTLKEKVGIVPPRLVKPQTATDYILFKDGPLTDSAAEAIGFVRTKYANQTDDYPDIELQFNVASINTDYGMIASRAQGLKRSFYEEVYKPIENKDVWSVTPILLRPGSRGVIKLRSKNPYDHPLIYPNYFSDPRDVATLVEGIKIVVNLSDTKSFQRFGSQYHNVTWPGCEHLEPFTDQMWECMLRQYTFSIYHSAGTAKMGPPSDRDAVVDPELKVYGISRLRVADLSIMPNVVSGNTNAPAIMIADKASDMIKEFWGISCNSEKVRS